MEPKEKIMKMNRERLEEMMKLIDKINNVKGAE